jgi:hypothetical protein
VRLGDLAGLLVLLLFLLYHPLSAVPFGELNFVTVSDLVLI